MGRPPLPWLLLSLALTPTLGDNSTYVPGSTCSDDDRPNRALAGKHLRVMELAWAPFAVIDETAPHGWTGFNIDLMDILAERLGFTYEIIDIGYPDADKGETWTDLAVRNIDNGDLIMSFWFRNPERINKLVPLDGHIDVSPGLIALRQSVGVSEEDEEDSWSFDTLTSFMRPFSWPMWLALFLMVLLSGVADFVIERHASHEARLSASIYEYAAGFLWGGFERPLSTSSKYYQVLLGFILLIVVATYTAELAAFITLNQGTKLSVTSVDNAMAEAKALCMEQGAYNDRMTANFPRMQYELILEANSAAQRLVEGSGCDGILAPKSFYDAWRTNPKNCNLEIVQTIWPDTACWLSSVSNMCVVRAINYALYDASTRGVVDRLYNKHFPVITCAAADRALDDIQSHGGESGNERRRLHTPAEEHRDVVGTAARAPRRSRSRRLKGGGGGGAAVGGDNDEVTQISVARMKGLFLIWLVITIVLITCTYVYQPLRKLLCLLKAKAKKAKHALRAKRGIKANQVRVVARSATLSESNIAMPSSIAVAVEVGLTGGEEEEEELEMNELIILRKLRKQMHKLETNLADLADKSELRMQVDELKTYIAFNMGDKPSDIESELRTQVDALKTYIAFNMGDKPSPGRSPPRSRASGVTSPARQRTPEPRQNTPAPAASAAASAERMPEAGSYTDDSLILMGRTNLSARVIETHTDGVLDAVDARKTRALEFVIEPGVDSPSSSELRTQVDELKTYIACRSCM